LRIECLFLKIQVQSLIGFQVDTYYINRNKHLENMCLYELVMNYTFKQNAKGALRQMAGPKGCMVQRGKQCVVRAPRHIFGTMKVEQAEQVYHQLLMLVGYSLGEV
jgi:hypothetical protein